MEETSILKTFKDLLHINVEQYNMSEVSVESIYDFVSAYFVPLNEIDEYYQLSRDSEK